MKNDITLLREISERSELAFKEIFERHRGKLYQFLVRIIKSRETSEEIIIDIFLKPEN